MNGVGEPWVPALSIYLEPGQQAKINGHSAGGRGFRVAVDGQDVVPSLQPAQALWPVRFLGHPWWGTSNIRPRRWEHRPMVGAPAFRPVNKSHKNAGL